MRANKATLECSIAAAGQIRDSSLQAAKLHMASTILNHNAHCQLMEAYVGMGNPVVTCTVDEVFPNWLPS
jgi:hypothetical protein